MMVTSNSYAKRWRSYLKWVMWALAVQLVLVNISASIYAYRFTHFYDQPSPVSNSQNIFEKTWKLFTGPKFYKNTFEPLPSFPYQVISLTTAEGIPIDAWYSEVDSSKGCILMVHGYNANKSYLVKEAAELRSWHYNVLLIDLRAHGRSGSTTISFGLKETDEVQKAFEFAKLRGNTNIILYGVSMGAGICIKAASEGKVKPRGLVADMPFGTLHGHLRSRARVLGFPSEPFAALVTFWIGMEKGYNAFNIDVSSYAKDLQCPALVEWGEQDIYVSRKEVERVYESLGSKDKKLVIYPTGGHDSFLQADPVVWRKEMQEFLNSLKTR